MECQGTLLVTSKWRVNNSYATGHHRRMSIQLVLMKVENQRMGRYVLVDISLHALWESDWIGHQWLFGVSKRYYPY